MAMPTPLPANPSNADLAHSINELHLCFESHRKEVRKTATKQTKTLADHTKQDDINFKALHQIVEVNTNNVKKLTEAFGLLETNHKKPIGLMSQTRLVLTIVTAVTAVGGVIRFVEFSAPYTWAYLVALHKFWIG